MLFFPCVVLYYKQNVEVNYQNLLENALSEWFCLIKTKFLKEKTTSCFTFVRMELNI